MVAVLAATACGDNISAKVVVSSTMWTTLRYLHRELDQVEAILGNTTTTPPSCVFGQ